MRPNGKHVKQLGEYFRMLDQLGGMSAVSFHASNVMITNILLVLTLCFLVGGQLLAIRKCTKVEEVPEFSFGHGGGRRMGGNLRLMICFCNLD